MTASLVTASERVFLRLCEELGYETHKIPERKKRKTPDFEVTHNGHKVIAEVKQFVPNAIMHVIKEKLLTVGYFLGPIDFSRDGGLSSKLTKQAEQLEEAFRASLPTLGVIYSERVRGETDYQVQHALEKKTVQIPKEISAVLWIRNEDAEGETDRYTLYVNEGAPVAFPPDMFGAQA